MNTETPSERTRVVHLLMQTPDTTEVIESINKTTEAVDKVFNKLILLIEQVKQNEIRQQEKEDKKKVACCIVQ